MIRDIWMVGLVALIAAVIGGGVGAFGSMLVFGEEAEPSTSAIETLPWDDLELRARDRVAGELGEMDPAGVSGDRVIGALIRSLNDRLSALESRLQADGAVRGVPSEVAEATSDDLVRSLHDRIQALETSLRDVSAGNTPAPSVAQPHEAAGTTPATFSQFVMADWYRQVAAGADAQERMRVLPLIYRYSNSASQPQTLGAMDSPQRQSEPVIPGFSLAGTYATTATVGSERGGVLTEGDGWLLLNSEQRAHADEFVFAATQGQRYRIELLSEDFDCFLVLFDPDRQAIRQDDDGAGSQDSRIEFRATRSGAYRLGVSAYAREGTGNYILRITPLDD